MGKILYTTLALGIVAFLISLSTPPHSAPLPAAVPPELPNPDDSIRTDLSDYLWPTEAAHVITSTFAEYRRTHFHGGIDIGTGNQTGFRVFAARDGYVSSISVSPNGYGKILYLRHYDGYYTTYAHLKHFAPEIDARVAQEQARLGRYSIYIECSPTEFRVNKGDLIAFSGETGVGTPHLHFEIRDQNFNFVNPLLCEGISAPDNILPVFRRIAVTPVTGESFVDGEWQPQIFRARRIKEGQYRIDETIHLTGAIGLAVEIRDQSNGSRYRHGLYSHRLFLDDTLIYTIQLDRAPSKEAHQIGLYYDWSLLFSGRGRFEKLYMDSENDLPFYQPKFPGAGILHTSRFAEGPHEFRIVSTDFKHNDSELTGTLILNHPPDFAIDESQDSLRLTFDDIARINKILLYSRRNGQHEWGMKTMTPEGYANGNMIDISYLRDKADVVKVVAENSWGSRSFPQVHFIRKPEGARGALVIRREMEPDFVRVIVRSNQPITSTPHLTVYEGPARHTIALRAMDIDEYVGTFRPQLDYMGMRRLVVDAEVNSRPAAANDEFDLFPLTPTRSGTIALDKGNLVLSYDSASVFRTVLLQMQKETGNHEVHYNLTPDDAVLNMPIRVSVAVDTSRRSQGLFWRTVGGTELLARPDAKSGARLEGTITRALGTLSVMTDDSPPHILAVKISKTSGRRPHISFRYGDDLSGVEYKELKMYIDSAVVIPEIDGEHRRAVYQAADPLERGSHLLTIRITDKMGNTSEVERRFTVR